MIAGIQYNAKLQRMVRAIKRDIDSQIVPLVRSLAPEYVTDSATPTHDGWGDIIAQAIRSLLAKWTDQRAQAAARSIAGDFVQAVDGRAKRTLGIDVYTGNQQLNDYLQAATLQNAQLIESIPTQYLAQVSNIVMGNMRAGLRPSAIVDTLQQQFGVTQRRAKMIARDQTAKVNGEISSKRQQAAGYSYFRWVTSKDERVRDRHQEIAEKVTRYGKGVYRWDNPPLSDKGEPIIPGSDYQCFPGDSPLNVFYGARKVFRHSYCGELTTLVTDSGEEIVCTPNHPVLTEKGFVAANLLDVGDHIVKVPDQSIGAANGQPYSFNTSFGEMFESAKLLGIIDKSASRFGGDFHGDIAANEEIDIVSFDWELPCEIDVVGCEEFFKLLFACTDQMFVNTCEPTVGDLSSVVSGLTLAPHSIVSSACKLLSFVTTGFTHADEHRLASVGLFYSSLVENSSDDVARCVEFFGNCFNTFTSVDERFDLFKLYVLAIVRHLFGSGRLETPGADRFAKIVGTTTEMTTGGDECITLSHKFERIVDKRISEFNGHVYNLQMGEGLFVAHNTAVSNCRCVAQPVSDEEVAKYRREGKTVKGVYR